MGDRHHVLSVVAGCDGAPTVWLQQVQDDSCLVCRGGGGGVCVQGLEEPSSAVRDTAADEGRQRGLCTA